VDGQKNCLGIYLSKGAATVVCLGPQGRGNNILGCFSVSVENMDQQNAGVGISEVVSLIVEGCAEKIPMFANCQVAVALDCAMFMQHNIHSEFSDPKQIAATVRFDTEEAVAIDISEFAIAFKTISSGQAGTKLGVFTAEQKILSEIIVSLQSHNIDPVSIEPDINSLARFINRNISVAAEQVPFFGVLSGSRGYFIISSEAQKISVMRTLLVGSAQDRSDLLAREILVTSALVEGGQPINCLKVFDSAGSVDYQQLGEKLGIETSALDLSESTAAEGNVDAVGLAIACGAAYSAMEKSQSINFRNDFMPYQGKKARMEKTLKILGVSIAVIMLAVGLYLQLQLVGKNRPRRMVLDKLAQQYATIMLGKKLSAGADPVKEFQKELRRIRAAKSGQLSITGQASVSAKLTRLLEAFNKCAKETDLNIESISITAKSISIIGDTAARGNKNTLKLFEAITSVGLDIPQKSFSSKAGRDNFRITIVPKE